MYPRLIDQLDEWYKKKKKEESRVTQRLTEIGKISGGQVWKIRSVVQFGTR